MRKDEAIFLVGAFEFIIIGVVQNLDFNTI